MLTIYAQVIKEEGDYKLNITVPTSNGLDITHTRLLLLGSDAVESLVMMRMPFKVEFDEIEAPVSMQSAIDKVNEQNAATAAETVVVDAEVVA